MQMTVTRRLYYEDLSKFKSRPSGLWHRVVMW